MLLRVERLYSIHGEEFRILIHNREHLSPGTKYLKYVYGEIINRGPNFRYILEFFKYNNLVKSNEEEILLQYLDEGITVYDESTINKILDLFETLDERV